MQISGSAAAASRLYSNPPSFQRTSLHAKTKKVVNVDVYLLTISWLLTTETYRRFTSIFYAAVSRWTT